MTDILSTTPGKVTAATFTKRLYVPFLRNIPFFSEFSEEGMDLLLKHSHICEHKKDALLFLADDEARNFYITISGLVKLFRETRDGHESVSAILNSGECFGRNSVLETSTFSYSAQTLSNCKFFVISADIIQYMAQQQSDFKGFSLKLMEDEFKDHCQHKLEMEHLAFMTSAQRVGCFLLRADGTQHKDRTTIQLPYEKSLIASRLGMTPETFSRSLQQLTSYGVRTQNSTIVIENIPALRRYTCAHCSAMINECVYGEEGEGHYKQKVVSHNVSYTRPTYSFSRSLSGILPCSGLIAIKCAELLQNNISV